MNYLGIDYGTKRIGLALASDETSPVPFATVPLSEVVKIITDEQIDVVVVGRPRAMGDTDRVTAIEKETQQFINNLKSQISIPVVQEDERLSSKGADALGKEFGQSGDRDAVAAMLILESYLGRQKKGESRNV